MKRTQIQYNSYRVITITKGLVIVWEWNWNTGKYEIVDAQQQSEKTFSLTQSLNQVDFKLSKYDRAKISQLLES